MILYKQGDWKKICWLLFALFIGIRFLFLDADPPEQLNWAWGEWVDAGSYSYNARNKVLFGTWELDDWNLMWVSPIPHWCTYAVFRLFGVGFWQNNLVPALFSNATVIVFFYLLRQWYPIFFVYLGTTLLGLNYLLITYARVGNRVTEMIFFLVLSSFLWSKGFQKSHYFYWAGISSMCAFLSKGSMIVFFIAMFLASVTVPVLATGWKAWKKWMMPPLLYSMGVATLIIFWYLVLFLPHQRIYDIFIGKDIKFRTPFSFDKFLSNVWQTPVAHYFYMYLPIIFSIALIYILKLFYPVVEHMKKWAPADSQSGNPSAIEVLALLWFLGDFFFNTIINYRPLRFFVSSIPPLIIIFTGVVYYLWHCRQIKIPRMSLLYAVVVFVWGFFNIHYFINEHAYHLYTIAPIKMFSYVWLPLPLNYYGAFTTLLFLTLLFTLMFLVIARLMKGKSFTINPLYPRIISIIIVVSALAFQISMYYEWVTTYKSYKIINYSRFLMELIPKGPISGNIAPMFCFENEFKVYLIYNDRNNWYNHPFERYGITHMQMAMPHDERDGYFYGFPDVMNQSKVIVTFPLKGRTEELWKIKPRPRPHITYTAMPDNTIKLVNTDTLLLHGLWIIPSSSPSSKFVVTLNPLEERILNYSINEVTIKPAEYNLELEQGRRESGMPVYDLDASKSVAIRSDARKNSIVYIILYQLDSSLYKVLLRVKYEKPTSDFKTIEINFYQEDGNLVAMQHFPTTTLIAGHYGTLSGTFNNPSSQRIIIEIKNPETDTMLFDVLQFVPIKEKPE
jgi:Dolichyl-phosphate-mannose-protein mannosyltransferase